MAIELEVHICNQRRSYKATFASEDQALAFCEARKSTHAIGPWDPESFDYDAAPRLDAMWNPTCHHGMSLWLCADPVNHYPADNQY